MQGALKASRMTLAVTGILLTLILHFGWELLQVPAFVGFADRSALVCFHCLQWLVVPVLTLVILRQIAARRR